MIQLNFFARRSADWRSGTDSGKFQIFLCKLTSSNMTRHTQMFTVWVILLSLALGLLGFGLARTYTQKHGRSDRRSGLVWSVIRIFGPTFYLVQISVGGPDFWSEILFRSGFWSEINPEIWIKSRTKNPDHGPTSSHSWFWVYALASRSDRVQVGPKSNRFLDRNRVRSGRKALIRKICVFDNRLEIINFVYSVKILNISDFSYLWMCADCIWILNMNQQKYLTSESEVLSRTLWIREIKTDEIQKNLKTVTQKVWFILSPFLRWKFYPQFLPLFYPQFLPLFVCLFVYCVA